MQVSIVQNGRVLRQIDYRQEHFIETPESGNYSIRVHNDSHRRRMVVLSVDGVNVVNGENAGFDGPGYVFNPWQTADIPGFRRTGGEVAAFTFKSDDESYAAQTGRGTNNVGIIGVAVFDEKIVVRAPSVIVKEVHHHHHNNPIWLTSLGDNTISVEPIWSSCTSDSVILNNSVDCNTRATKSAPTTDSIIRSRGRTPRVGTGYGERVEFRTTDTDFTKATKKPNLLMTFRYGTREQLIGWGVPVDVQEFRPNAFPASQPSVAVQAPPGWRG